MHRFLHHLVCTSVFGLLVGVSGCSGSGSAPSAPPAASAVATGPVSYSVTVSVERPATLAQEQLTLRLTEVKDSRCPEGAQCVWAGHAVVTLNAEKTGLPTQPVTIGSEAPENLKLPYQATYGPYTLTLSQLSPRPTKEGSVPLSRYEASVQITRP